MITVKELRVVQDRLIIDVEINSAFCQSSCLITKIEIYNQDNYNSENPSYVEDGINSSEWSGYVELDTDVIDLHSTDLFFVSVYWDGTPIPDCPCGQDESPDNFIVYNKQLVYNKGIQYLRNLSDCCTNNTCAINFILMQKYFDLCLSNGNIVEAIDLWNKMINNTSTTTYSGTTNTCGCHA